MPATKRVVFDRASIRRREPSFVATTARSAVVTGDEPGIGLKMIEIPAAERKDRGAGLKPRLFRQFLDSFH